MSLHLVSILNTICVFKKFKVLDGANETAPSIMFFLVWFPGITKIWKMQSAQSDCNSCFSLTPYRKRIFIGYRLYLNIDCYVFYNYF
jgi:hypothetical protein